MSKMKINGWSDRFALIDHYKPTDEQACTALNVSVDELETARELRTAGRFNGESNINVEKFASLFNVPTKMATKQSTTTSHIKPSTKPDSATETIKVAKKRGRKGEKIANAFLAIPASAISADQFAAKHNVSLAVLRQSRRFDKSGLGPVRVKKDKETKQLMIWREATKS